LVAWGLGLECGCEPGLFVPGAGLALCKCEGPETPTIRIPARPHVPACLPSPPPHQLGVMHRDLKVGLR
jgi:hypothetical protein